MSRPYASRRLIRMTAERLGFVLSTSNPGDGRRRYEFCKVNRNGGSFCFTALGSREAYVFLLAYEGGMNEAAR